MKINRPFAICMLVSLCAALGLGIPTALSQSSTPSPVSTAAATAAPVTTTTTPPPTVDIAATATQVAKSPHLTVTSADGKVTLLIPQGALPANTTASAISIRPLKTSDSSLAVIGQPPLAAYQMLPDGLQFTIPALIRVTLDKTADTRIPLLATISGQTITPLSPSRVEVDPKTGKKAIIATIAHFSSVVAVDGEFVVTLTVSGDPYKVIGDTFTAEVQVGIIPSAEPVAPPGQAPPNTPTPLDRSLSLDGTWLASSSIAPLTIIFAPHNARTIEGPLQDSESFSCVSTGTSQDLVYIADVNYRALSYETHPRVIFESYVEVVVTSEPFSCNHLVTKFVAKFVQAEFATHYTVTAIDPDGQPLTYEWSNTNGCGSFPPSTSAEAVWLHPDSNLAGACPNEPIHKGTIKVVVSSTLGAKEIVQYFGGSGNGTMVPKGSQ
ncbi:MAG: YbbR-like domain-containing protein [Aggregatilineales bacterium]